MLAALELDLKWPQHTLELQVRSERGQVSRPEQSMFRNMIRWEGSGLGEVTQVKRGDD